MSDTSPALSKRQHPEILAPAGSKEAFFAAVAAGADAVYLGGPRFGARHFADNFNEKDIGEAVEYAHLRGVKVYVTVNTLVQDRELPDAMLYLFSLYRMGVDAVLIQDVGLFALSREMIPGLCLHASTQCTISSIEGALWAKMAGFSRVVMARETPMSEIDRILGIPASKRPGIEVFIHGALCYSYSGQCLLSSVIGGRSGNRGMCAQPCRKPYRLVRSIPDQYARPTAMSEIPCRDLYLLSTRDICGYPNLDEIVARDVDALKIEGRMRSPEYVATVVRVYRSALNALKEGRKWYSLSDMDDMALAFSRGFTRGYLLGDRGPDLMGRDHPGNRGLLIGTVIGTTDRRDDIRIRPISGYIPVAGDGILIVDPAGREQMGYALNKNGEHRGRDLIIKGDIKGVTPGSRVYITGSMRLPARLKEILRTGSPESRIPVMMKVRIAPGEHLQGLACCSGRDGLMVRVRYTTPFIPEQAKTNPSGREVIYRQLQKTGETPFSVQKIHLDYHGDSFIPISELNRLRRDLLSMLEAAWLQASLPKSGDIELSDSRVRSFVHEYTTWLSRDNGMRKKDTSPDLAVYCGTPDELIAACDAGCDAVYYEVESAEWNECLQELVEGSHYCRDQGISFTWKWPRITGGFFLQCALPQVPGLFRAGVTRIMVEELGIAEAILAREPEMEILGGMGLNIYNARAALALHPPITGFTLSPELSSSQLATLLNLSGQMTPGIRYEVVCQGNLDAMISQDCLLTTLVKDHGVLSDAEQFGLQDETGHVFLVYEDRDGRTHILNAVETTLIDRIPCLLETGISSLAIDARRRGPVYTREMTGLYRESIEAALQGLHDQATWTGFKNRARMMARGGITRGHFERGVAGYSERCAE